MKTPRTPIATCPDVGKVIRTHIKKRRISKAALSRNVNHNHQALHSILQRHSLQLQTLWELCVAMRHNFLLDLAAQLPADFTTHAPDPTLAQQEELEQLREENKILSAKLEELRNAIGKR